VSQVPWITSLDADPRDAGREALEQRPDRFIHRRDQDSADLRHWKSDRLSHTPIVTPQAKEMFLESAEVYWRAGFLRERYAQRTARDVRVRP
jgi:hypothetical protein